MMERKPKFRSRKLDFNKQLGVYRYDEIDEFEDFDSPLRSVAPVATGVDKEEEEEHHLRQALSHQSTKTQPYYIPTPEASEAIKDYSSLYPASWKMVGKTYLKPTTNSDELLVAFPRYDADEEDLAFVEQLRSNGEVSAAFTILLFEWIIDCFEDAAHKFSESIVSSESLDRLKDKFSAALPTEDVINKIIDYWKQRRTRNIHLIPFLRHEDVGKLGADPYVCFRRRELKIPRKTRRTETQIQDRLKKLHFDLSSIKLALEAGMKRDRFKREALQLEGELFEKYCLVDNWRKHNKTDWPAQLPPFKVAAQSLLEQRKKRPRTDSIADMDEPPHRPSGSIKIAIPAAVLKNSRYHKAYYPQDIDRAIHRDFDAILGFTSTSEVIEAKLADLSSPLDYPPPSLHRPMRVIESMRGVLRRGRGGRFIIERPTMEPRRQRPISDLPDEYIGRYQANLLTPKDFAALQTPVGNYNVHAVQTANQILKPMSFQAWVAATAPILAAMNNGSGSSGDRPKSPKKKRPKPNPTTTTTSTTNTNTNTTAAPSGTGTNPPSSDPDTPSPQQTTPLNRSTSALSQLGGSGGSSQITVNVKVKNAPHLHSGSDQSLPDAAHRTSAITTTTTTTATHPKETRRGTATRFTPHGLAPDSAVSVKKIRSSSSSLPSSSADDSTVR